ncbi:MAG: radical SAM protein [Deltaproteobacteria bacterium]|nr:radical SAM protein [Deltaproteobacteria bacterium]
MRVVLVHPAGSNWVPGKKDVTVAANRMVPIGVISMAAYLEPLGHEVFVHDCLGPRAPRGVDANVAKIVAFDPDLVGFSTTTSGFLDAYAMAEQIKKQRPEVIVVFGGVHVSGFGAKLLERFHAIDCLVIGEGEVTLSELAAGESLSRIDGLAWRDGEELVTNPPRKKIPEIDALPFPAYNKLEGFPRGYRLPPFSYIHTPGAAISTSRGCVFRCSYCDRSVFKKGFRSNSAEYTYAHLQFLRNEFGIRHVNIYDDLFTNDRKRILELCDKLARNPLGLRFNCAVRVGQTDDELLDALVDAGCLMVSLGVESGDPSLLKDLKSGVTLEEVRGTVSRIQAKGLRAKGLFMMGVVGETEESITRTSDFIIETGFDDMNMSKFTPFPGAPCWSTIRDHGTFDEDWRLMNALNFVFVPGAIESRDRLDQLYNTHVKRFYTDREWRKKFKRRIWQHRATLTHMLLHLPTFLAAKKHFEPS